MKELKLLSEWADSIVEYRKPQQSARMGTPMSGNADRPLPRKIDVAYKAQRAHPELSPEQALSLYMSDELEKNDQMNLEQNKVINAQKRQNEKLTRSLEELSKELHDHEKMAGQTDQEVARLKDLSAKLKPAGEIQQQTIKASSEKVQQMLNQLDVIKDKPGMDPAKVKEIEDKIQQIKNSPADNTDINKVNAALAVLAQKQEVDDNLFGQVMDRLEQTENALDKKEKRFQKSIRKNAEKIGSWGNKFSDLDQKVSGVEDRANEVLNKVEAANDDIDDKLNRMAELIYKLNPETVKQAGTAMANVVPSRSPDETEVDVAKVKPEGPSPEEMQAARLEKQAANSDWQSELNKSKVINLFKSRPMTEVTEMNNEPMDYEKWIESVAIPNVIRWYHKTYPLDLKQYSVDQLKEIIRRTITGGLLIYGKDVDSEKMDAYCERVRRWLRKSRPANPELPGMSNDVPEPQSEPTVRQQASRPAYEWPPRPDNFSESLVHDYEASLTKLTGGY
jgi:hypothetical protein